MGSSIPRLVILGSLGKQAEQAMGGKPVNKRSSMASASICASRLLP